MLLQMPSIRDVILFPHMRRKEVNLIFNTEKGSLYCLLLTIIYKKYLSYRKLKTPLKM